jgi:hypothetical protein
LPDGNAITGPHPRRWLLPLAEASDVRGCLSKGFPQRWRKEMLGGLQFRICDAQRLFRLQPIPTFCKSAQAAVSATAHILNDAPHFWFQGGKLCAAYGQAFHRGGSGPS